MAHRFSLVEVALFCAIVLVSGIAVSAALTRSHWIVIIICVLGVIALALLLIRYSFDPDRLRARQSGRMLKIAAQTLTYMRTGLNEESAAAVCRLLLPATSANAVAITDTQKILGYVGAEQESHTVGSPIKNESTRRSIQYKTMQVLKSKEELGRSEGDTSFVAAVVVPLMMMEQVVGTLKFFYRKAKKIDATEQTVAQGLATLLGMQLSLADLDYQREQAAKMELKALQAQIRPHFLFNTINTIAALIRTDPAQARVLLREFATFYRRTLEGSLDYISLEQEYLQTLRYLGFEVARFGADRITLNGEIEKGLESIMVPAFIIQPLVENAVGHGMREDAPLHVEILAKCLKGEVIIEVADDGIGIPRHIQDYMLTSESKNTGIALKNVHDRLRGFFGSKAYLEVQSEEGAGTTVCLHLGPMSDLRVDPHD